MNFAMISMDTYLRPIWIAVFVQSVTWSFSDSRPDKSAHLSPWNWDDDWDKYFPSTTRRPYIWDRYTSPPDTFGKRHNTSSGPEPIVWFIIGGVILISLFIMLIRYVCEHSDDDDTSDTSPVLHPPPAVIVPPPMRNYQGTTIPPPPSQQSRNATPATLGGGIYNSRAPPSATTHGAGDKPPGYSEVVMADFVEQMKFPEVAPKLPDTPPPKYEDGNLPKY